LISLNNSHLTKPGRILANGFSNKSLIPMNP
jgi:hypothetical protein